jgi:hypothetical protein
MKSMTKLQITKEDAKKLWVAWKEAHMDIYNQLRIECATCGSKIELVLHHKDLNRSNNTLSNLVCLCNSCHWKLHHTMGRVCYLDKWWVYNLLEWMDKPMNKKWLKTRKKTLQALEAKKEIK